MDMDCDLYPTSSLALLDGNRLKSNSIKEDE